MTTSPVAAAPVIALRTLAGTRTAPLELIRLQQAAGNQAVAKLIVQRRQVQHRRRGAHQPVPAPMPGPLVYLVVRDRGLNAGGGILVANLTVAKQVLMRGRNEGVWTLVLSVHGSEDKLGAQAPPHWRRNAVFYDAAAIDALFGADKAFVAWRDRYGPNHLVLNACQVSLAFERNMIENLTRAPGKGQRRQAAQGLGTGCRPLTTTERLRYTQPKLHFRNTPITTRAQWRRIPEVDRATLQQQLIDLNREFGYFGRPPVPEADVLAYYFETVPLGGWPRVEVGVGPHLAARPTGIPFWNRATGPKSAEFLRLCGQGIGQFPPRHPIAPPSP